MSNTVDWANPYQDRRGEWLRGQLHSHTSPASSCGRISAQAILDGYAAAGADFLAVSDHMVLTEARDDRLILIPGLEWDAGGADHTGLYAADFDALRPALAIGDQAALLEAYRDRPVLVVLNHPNWNLTPHYPHEAFDGKGPFDGIEIYSGLIELITGCATATYQWDYLLTKGRRVLGFAGDDAHGTDSISNAWLCVRSPGRSATDVLGAIRRGNFYASSGVVIDDIRRDGKTIEIETADAQEIRIIGEGGCLLGRVAERAAAYTAPADPPAYVRFAAYGQGAARAWTQPFFL